MELETKKSNGYGAASKTEVSASSLGTLMYTISRIAQPTSIKFAMPAQIFGLDRLYGVMEGSVKGTSAIQELTFGQMLGEPRQGGLLSKTLCKFIYFINKLSNVKRCLAEMTREQRSVRPRYRPEGLGVDDSRQSGIIWTSFSFQARSSEGCVPSETPVDLPPGVYARP